MSTPHGRGSWDSFKPHRPQPPRAGKGVFFLALVFAALVGGGLGALAGALWNPGPRSTRVDRLARDTPAQMTTRAVIGGAIGAALAGWSLARLWKRNGD